MVFRKELAVLFVVVFEKILVVPQGVVGVESYSRYGPAHYTGSKHRQWVFHMIAKRMSLTRVHKLLLRPENLGESGPKLIEVHW